MNDKYVFFYGHEGGSADDPDKRCLSNFFYCPIVYMDTTFLSSEQLFMYIKAMSFGDEIAAGRIINYPSPSKCKSIGRKVKNFDADIWDMVSYGAMYQACFAKFSQNEKLGQYLLSTGDKILVEASPRDSIWGIGMDINYAESTPPEVWMKHGENRLGKVLMDVRKVLYDKGREKQNT